MSELPDHVIRATRENVEIVPYDASWPKLFETECRHLRGLLPSGIIGRIEHFGSTAVPGLAGKPIIDMLVEVTSLADVRQIVAPILTREGYEYFWRPCCPGGVDIGYAWFIKRDADGRRTHHIHMLEKDSPDWERLLFRDYLIEHPEVAYEYAVLKQRIVADFPGDRIAYAKAKTGFITRFTEAARLLRGGERP